MELGIASAARKLSDSLVNSFYVTLQVMVGTESVRAFLAAEPFPIMFLHVSPQPSFSVKFGTTDLTLLRFLTVAKQMLPETSLIFEGFVA